MKYFHHWPKQNLSFLQFNLWFFILTLFAGCTTASKSELPAIAANSSPLPVYPLPVSPLPASPYPTANITKFGVFDSHGSPPVRTVRNTQNSETLSFYNSRTPFSWISTTDQIPGILKTHFGFVFQIWGLPPYGSTNVSYTISHPLIQLPNGQSSTNIQWTSEEHIDASGMLESYVGYGFAEPYEIAAGTWVFRIYLDNQLMLRKEFQVSLSKK
ncbi:MAG: hypothetical protein JWM68_3632 [Verrucomicrobiales bacterium]|nr:hypothetical protein [Verrucomicrobiales bacterium]